MHRNIGKKKIASLEEKLNCASQQEYQELKRKIDWMKETEDGRYHQSGAK